MSSLVIFEHKGIVVEWHKYGPYTVRSAEETKRYKNRTAALAAAVRLVKALKKDKAEAPEETQ